MVYISASVEEYIHVCLFATVRGTFKCLHALASRPEEKREPYVFFPILRMRIESTRLIHNNIHNTQMVIHNLINIHKLINIHESTLFEILPGGNTDIMFQEGSSQKSLNMNNN